MKVALKLLSVVLLMSVPEAVGQKGSPWDGARAVSKERIVEVMHNQERQGYALAAISNSVRMQAGVFLDLTEEAARLDPERRPLRVGHQEYFEAFLEVTGIPRDEVPTFVQVPHEYREDYLLDYRMENVIERVLTGDAPLRALNVKAGWPAAPDAPRRYSYDDASTSPKVQVTHERVNAYRILDFGDVIVYDDIHGITGRATSGLLGVVFKILGKARAVQTRFAISPDGVQISRTKARKIISKTQTVTIFPDGQVQKGCPEGRPDLDEKERALKRLRIDVEYAPMDLGPMTVP